MNDQALDDLGKTTWRDDQWLGFYPLNHFTALDYFSLSPFYDRSCNNEVAKAKKCPYSVSCILHPLGQTYFHIKFKYGG